MTGHRCSHPCGFRDSFALVTTERYTRESKHPWNHTCFLPRDHPGRHRYIERCKAENMPIFGVVG